MKCLIVDYMHEDIEELLGTLSIKADYRPEITRGEIIEKLPEYDGLIIRSKTKVDEGLLKHAGKLKFVARAGAGIDNLDTALLKERKITIINAPEGNRNALGEHCVGLLLSVVNNIIKADSEIRSGIWDREANRGYELAGKTVALLGYGHMGKSFARKLQCFDCEVLAFDKYKDNYSDGYAQKATMEEIYRKADIFSLHVPLTNETRNLVDLNYLNNFKKNIFLLNTARGEVMPLASLCKALESGKVIGAGLDVLENEKLDSFTKEEQNSFDYLVKSTKTVLTPHVAGWSFESYRRINEVIVAKIKAEIIAAG